MPHPPGQNVVSHWHKLIENFKTSPLEFYAGLEASLRHRQIEGVDTREIEWSEGGVLSPRRKYLRISADRLEFHVCAAPYGTGFFFSWWLVKRPPSGVFLYWVLILGVMAALFFALGSFLWAMLQVMPHMLAWLYAARLASVPIVLSSPFITFWLVAVAARIGLLGPEDAVLSTPLVSGFYRRVYAPETFHKLDTIIMFRTAVHAAVVEVIDGLTAQKGLRALSEDERKPVLDLVA